MAGKMTREQKISVISLIILVGFTFAILYHYILSVYLGLNYPFNTFLSQPEDRWMDFIWPYMLSMNPYVILRPSHQNFPFLYKLASGFRILPPALSLFTFLFLFWALFAYICMRELRTENRIFNLQTAFIFCFLSYPILISLDRANFEILEFLFLYLFIFYYQKRPNLSALALGCGIALKAFPVVLAILLQADKKYKQLIIAALTSFIITMISYATLPGGVGANILYHLVNLKLYAKFYVIDNLGLFLGNSIWGGLKFISIWTNSPLIVGPSTYTRLSIIVLIAISFYIIFIENSFWKKTALAVCSLNLLPVVSGDYKLLHLFIPLFLFINTSKQSKYDMVYVVLFGLLLIPKGYYHLPTLPEANIAILLNPVLMLLMVLLIIFGRQVSKLPSST
jgi:hypothetical protein